MGVLLLCWWINLFSATLIHVVFNQLLLMVVTAVDADHSPRSRREWLFLCVGVCKRSWFGSKWLSRPERYVIYIVYRFLIFVLCYFCGIHYPVVTFWCTYHSLYYFLPYSILFHWFLSHICNSLSVSYQNSPLMLWYLVHLG